MVVSMLCSCGVPEESVKGPHCEKVTFPEGVDILKRGVVSQIPSLKHNTLLEKIVHGVD